MAVKQVKGCRRYDCRHGNRASVTVEGSYSFGPFDAAKKYAASQLAGFEVLSGGREERPDCWRFEAINNGRQLGEVIWVTPWQA